MASFTGDLNRFARKTVSRAHLVHEGATQRALAGIKLGDSLTGAPGQPVDEGDLIESWHVRKESAAANVIETDSPYARSNEDGIARPGGGPYIQRSPKGGRFSVALTIAGWQRIVAHIVRQLGDAR